MAASSSPSTTATLDYTIVRSETFAETLDFNITVTNIGNQTREFAVFAVLGTSTGKAWWGPATAGHPGYYVDGLIPCSVGNVQDEWYRNAFISTPMLSAGESFAVTRSILVPYNSSVTDSLVMVVAKEDMSIIFAYEMKPNVVQSSPGIPLLILSTVTELLGALSLLMILGALHRRQTRTRALH